MSDREAAPLDLESALPGRHERDAEIGRLIAERRTEILAAVRAGFPPPPLTPTTNARIESLAGDLLAAEVRELHCHLLCRGRPEPEVRRT